MIPTVIEVQIRCHTLDGMDNRHRLYVHLTRSRNAGIEQTFAAKENILPPVGKSITVLCLSLYHTSVYKRLIFSYFLTLKNDGNKRFFVTAALAHLILLNLHWNNPLVRIP